MSDTDFATHEDVRMMYWNKVIDDALKAKNPATARKMLLSTFEFAYSCGREEVRCAILRALGMPQ